ncbi:MAG: hypothetical protein IKJ55_06200 [Clostridia bacterium]|nr:hypothetical protein [Clostridia bacterium]
MLYKKNKGETLDMDLFENPTSEYRATPFWAWNGDLEKEKLLRQIEAFKSMGFGGFHMHSRSGLSTEYLSEEFMDMVKFCRDKAEKEEMLAWLYDEDRYPSGFAGGLVTNDPIHRQKLLRITHTKKEFVSKEEGTKTGKAYLVATFDVQLDENGYMTGYKRIEQNQNAEGIKRYFYVETAGENGWWNNTAYADLLSPETVKKFIDVTYEKYKEAVGERFGKSVPAIFTDEPEMAQKRVLSAPDTEDLSRIFIPWTTNLDDTYFEEYGEHSEDKIPELFWDLVDEKVSVTRYRYHEHTAKCFYEAFAQQCGDWCEKNNIALTGHFMHEETLEHQCQYNGDVMRHYKNFGIPGIDMLCNNVQLNTAKQCQSVKNQTGKEAMLSELYGVTNWDFDFKSHKFQGDWQAALGVTVRVPHLSWYCMKGSAKRDYPASIHYQAPWYKDYKYIEDHFARLNTVLTRGTPEVQVGIIHPIESYWLHTGPNATSGDVAGQLDENFENLTKWLLSGMVDFDFISESLLPGQAGEISNTLSVGEMHYKTVIVPGCETLRGSTFEILKKFKQKGGRILFIGDCPKYIDVAENDGIKDFYACCEKTVFEKNKILNQLKSEQTCRLVNGEKQKVEKYVHCLRNDNGKKWLFLAPSVYEYNKKAQDIQVQEELCVELEGAYAVKLYDTLAGDVKSVPFETKNGKTYIYIKAAPFDSFLFELTKGEGKYVQEGTIKTVLKTIDFKQKVSYTRSEDNVYVLDMAEYKLDGGEWQPFEELSRIDTACRKILSYPAANGKDAQPWVLGKDNIEHYVTLKFTIPSKIAVDVDFAAEEAEEVLLNGRAVTLCEKGYYTDESIVRYALGTLQAGINELIVKVPIGKRTSVENCFLLGEFDVSVSGCIAEILPASDTIAFGNIVSQGMPFYGGHIRYETEIQTDCDANLAIRVNVFRGAAVKVYLDGAFKGYIVCPPYILNLENVKKGKHTVTFELLGSRVNTFGPLHHVADTFICGPQTWYGEKEKWSYQYILKETGILASPVIEILK